LRIWTAQSMAPSERRLHCLFLGSFVEQLNSSYSKGTFAGGSFGVKRAAWGRIHTRVFGMRKCVRIVTAPVECGMRHAFSIGSHSFCTLDECLYTDFLSRVRNVVVSLK